MDILRFFFSPTVYVEKLKTWSQNSKLILVTVYMFLMTSVAYIVTPLWILPLGFDVVSFLTNLIAGALFNLAFAGMIYFVGKGWKNKIQWSFVDNLFFIALSSLVFVLSPIAAFLIIKLWLLMWSFLGTFFFLGWSLILISKSLSKLNNVTEGRITFIVVWAIVFLYVINSFAVAPMLGISMF